jgi:pimeloyl-ACP methyl ester carboxylesterase
MKNLKSGLVPPFLIFISILFFSGCAGKNFTYPNAPFNTKAGELVLEPGLFETESKQYNADYGTLVVPENRFKDDSRLIELPVIRIHSSSSKPAEPIFFLHGGPGGSNIRAILPEYLLANHDIVMVGYRGTDGSFILDCPEVESALKADGNALSQKYLKNTGEAWKNCASRLKNDGVDLDGYTMMEVIEDMETVRAVLDYKRVNLLSVSYGTRVAYIYALKHPDRIYRSAMIGVNPPDHFGWEPETIDAQLDYYADLWTRDPEMAAHTPDLLATMRDVAHNMPDNWLFFDINPGKVKLVTFFMLYHRAEAAKVFDAYVAAKNGDPSGLAFMSMAYDFALPSSVIWGDFASKSFSADYDSTRDYFNEMEPENSIIGSPMGKLAWASLQFGSWPIKQIPKEFRQLQHSDVETLIISGSIDFSTPAEFATNELLPYLSRGKQVIISEVGHVKDVYRIKPEITERLLMSFYSTGVPDESLNTYIPMDFNVDWGWPKTAKTGVGVTFGLLALLILLL